MKENCQFKNSRNAIVCWNCSWEQVQYCAEKQKEELGILNCENEPHKPKT
jgi:hypothetical protein